MPDVANPDGPVWKPRPTVVLTREVRRLAMAVAAQELKVLEAVVVPVAVHVMERQRQWLPTPLTDPAFLTAPLLQPRIEKPALQMPPTDTSTLDEVCRDWRGRRSRSEIAACPSLVPCLRAESEPGHALASGVPRVMEALNGGPVVPPCALVHRLPAETARVIRHRRLGDGQLPCNIGRADSRFEQFEDEVSGLSGWACAGGHKV